MYVNVQLMDAAERQHYRNTLMSIVTEVLYHAWQRGREDNNALTIPDLVENTRGYRPDASIQEITRALADLEFLGIAEQISDERWRRVATETRRRDGHLPIHPLCPEPGCRRPDNHDLHHLPLLATDHLRSTTIIEHEEFAIVWPSGATSAHIYPSIAGWAAGEHPLGEIPIQTEPHTHDALLGFITTWIARRNIRSVRLTDQPEQP